MTEPVETFKTLITAWEEQESKARPEQPYVRFTLRNGSHCYVAPRMMQNCHWVPTPPWHFLFMQMGRTDMIYRPWREGAQLLVDCKRPLLFDVFEGEYPVGADKKAKLYSVKPKHVKRWDPSLFDKVRTFGQETARLYRTIFFT